MQRDSDCDLGRVKIHGLALALGKGKQQEERGENTLSVLATICVSTDGLCKPGQVISSF